MSAVLYRVRNAAGDLLYVGITSSALRRASEHADAKGWWSDVASIEVEAFETRDEATAAERRAVANEQPRHNVHFVRPRERHVDPVGSRGGVPRISVTARIPLDLHKRLVDVSAQQKRSIAGQITHYVRHMVDRPEETA